MLNLSDKELDRFSREAAGQYEVEVDNLSWEKLRQQLDEEIGNAPPKRPVTRLRRPLVYFSLLVLIAGISWLLLKPAEDKIIAVKTLENQNKISPLNKQSGSEKTAKDEGVMPETILNRSQQEKPDSKNPTETNQKTSSSNQKLVEPPLPVSGDQIKGEIVSNPAENLLNAETSNKERIQKQESVNGTTKSYNNKKNDNSLAGKQGNEAKIRNRTENNISNSSAKVRMTKPRHLRSENELAQSAHVKFAGKKAKAFPAQSTDITGQSTDIYENRLAREIKPAIIPGPESIMGNEKIQIKDVSLLSSTALIKNTITPQNSGMENSRYLNLSKPLHIGVLIAPDLTKVETTLPNNLSATFGLTLAYQLLRNWSVNTGFLYTKKNYVAKGYDFHNNSMPNLDHAVGNCNMIEIPLTLRYDFGRIKKASFFVNGGLSSYFMKKESYTYYEKDPGSIPWGADLKTNKNYWFSLATFSMGVEENLSKNLSIQAEPFVKLPLTGIGYGNLQLSSYGVNFTIRYSPVLKTTRH